MANLKIDPVVRPRRPGDFGPGLPWDPSSPAPKYPLPQPVPSPRRAPAPGRRTRAQVEADRARAAAKRAALRPAPVSNRRPAPSAGVARAVASYIAPREGGL